MTVSHLSMTAPVFVTRSLSFSNEHGTSRGWCTNNSVLANTLGTGSGTARSALRSRAARGAGVRGAGVPIFPYPTIS